MMARQLPETGIENFNLLDEANSDNLILAKSKTKIPPNTLNTVAPGRLSVNDISRQMLKVNF